MDYPLTSWLALQVADILSLPVAQVDRQARFRDLGLDSAAITRLVAALGQHLQRSLPVTLPYRYPSINALAQALDGSAEGTDDALKTHDQVDEAIAVIGLACRLPGGATNPQRFAELLAAGTDATTPLPDSRWSLADWYAADPSTPGRCNSGRGAFLDSVDGFDARFWGISPREAQSMDPQQRLFLELAWEALEDAAIVPASLRASRTGVYAGVMWREYGSLSWQQPDTIAQHTLTGGEASIVPARVSYALGLRGPCVTVDTACSASAVAIHLACQALRLGEAELALAGGVNLMLAPYNGVALAKFGGLAPDGRCKSFSAEADGYGRGEGGGIVVLKPLARALRDGDPIYCLIRGSATNNDGASNGLTAPCPVAQRAVIGEAWSRAGLRPADCTLVEAHGTGTQLGDPIEAEALGAVFAPGREADQPLLLGSVKSQIGHLEAAAGIAGLIKLALALDRQTLYGTLHADRPNPHIDFAGLGLKLQHAKEAWPSRPLLAGLSSFGIGGSNCHLVLSGRPGAEPARVVPSGPRGAERPRLVFVYSGCGSQWPGMAQDLLGEPIFRQTLERCERIFSGLLGISVLDELCAAPTRAKTDSASGQVLLFCLQVALTELLRSWGVEADATLGQSIGEAAAAYAAGHLSLEDAALVMAGFTHLAERGAGLGGLLLVELDAASAAAALAPFAPRLEVAGRLSANSTVVAGDTEALARFEQSCRARGLKPLRVQIDYACHSALVEPQLEHVRALLAPLQPMPARLPMFSSVSADWLPNGACDADYWCRNYRQGMRFDEAVRQLNAETPTLFLELSAHPLLRRPLANLLAEDDRNGGRQLATLWRGESAPANLRACLEELHRAGFAVDWSRYLGQEPAASPTSEPHLFLLGLHQPEALAARSSQLCDYLTAQPKTALAPLAATLALGRSHFKARRALVASSVDELRERLLCAEEGQPTGELGPPVLLFTGQGSQYPAMARALRQRYPIVAETLARCAAVLDPLLPIPLERLLTSLEGDDLLVAPLRRTQFAQPALFALELAVARLWLAFGIAPSACLGHSVGELAAACLAGVFSIEDGCRLVAARGRLMDSLPDGGAMVALGCSAAEALTRIRGHEETLSLAAINAPNQVVVSGAARDLHPLVARCEAEGLRCHWLDVSHAFHSPLMAPILDEFAEVARSISYHPPRLRLISCLGPGREHDMASPDYWVEQLRAPVDFDSAARTLRAEGANCFIEVGPKPALLGMLAEGDFSTPSLYLPSLTRADGEGRQLLESLGRYFAHGGQVDWRPLYANLPSTRLSLPPYPFQRQRHWLEAAGQPVGTTKRGTRRQSHRIRLGLARTGRVPATDPRIHALRWHREGHQPTPAARSRGEWLLFGGDSAFDARLVEQFAALGVRCQLVRPAAPRVGAEAALYDGGLVEAYTATLASYVQSGKRLEGIVFAGALACTLDDLEQGRFERIFEDGCTGLLGLLQALLRNLEQPPLLMVLTRGSQAIAADDTAVGLAQAPVWGLARVIALEHPELRCQCIDLDPARPEAEAAWLAGTALRAGDGDARENLRAYREGCGWVPRLTAQPRPATAPLAPRADATYLITGGQGELGLALAEHLVARGARHLVLVSRSSAGSAQSAAIGRLASSGARVRLLRADLTQPGEAARIIARIRNDLPPLRGVFHAAGMLEDGVLARLPLETLRVVLGPKFIGAWNLHQATRELELDVFMMFSSIASVLGSAGQGSYTAANAFLDSLAHHRCAQGLPALAINWGAFRGTGMAAAGGDATWRARGVSDFAPAEAWSFLDCAVTARQPQLTFARLEPQAFDQVWSGFALFDAIRPVATASTTADIAPPQDFGQRWRTASAGERPELLARQVKGALYGVLGLGQHEPLDHRQGFAAMGLDSLMAVELRNRLQQQLGCSLPATLLFDHPNFERLQRFLFDHLDSAPPAQATPAARIAPRPTLIEALELPELGDHDLDELGGAELDRAIAAELTALEKLAIFEDLEP